MGSEATGGHGIELLVLPFLPFRGATPHPFWRHFGFWNRDRLWWLFGLFFFSVVEGFLPTTSLLPILLYKRRRLYSRTGHANLPTVILPLLHPSPTSKKGKSVCLSLRQAPTSKFETSSEKATPPLVGRPHRLLEVLSYHTTIHEV